MVYNFCDNNIGKRQSGSSYLRYMGTEAPMYTATFQAYKNSNICRPEMHLSTKFVLNKKKI